MSWRQKLARRSHDPGFLWRTAIWIVAAGVALSFLPGPEFAKDSSGLFPRYLSSLKGPRASPQDPWSPLLGIAATLDSDPYEMLHLISKVASLTNRPAPAGLFETLGAESSDQEFAEIAQQLASSVQAESRSSELIRLASASPPQPLAVFASALYHLQTDQLASAIPELRATGESPQGGFARKLLVEALLRAEQWNRLAELMEDPAYAPLVPSFVASRLAAERGDWLTVLHRSPATVLEGLAPGPTTLALLTGGCWLAFILHAGGGGVRWWLCVAGVLLGAASIPLTHFFTLFQEVGWGLEDSDQLAGGLRYYVLGVGLREEFAKLTLLLPLIPLLVRGRSELETLLVSACVGLGFALVENTSYFGSSIGASTVGRLTTANFLHMSLTGLVGLAVCRGCWHPKTLGPEALAVFALASIAHGLYDSLIILPALEEYSLLTMILYVLIVYRFFHEFNAARPTRTSRINISFTFTVGVAVVAAATFVYLSWQTDQRIALRLLSYEMLASAVTIYLFLREAPDSLIER